MGAVLLQVLERAAVTALLELFRQHGLLPADVKRDS